MSEEIAKEPKTIREKKVERNEKGQILPGVILNPEGRPKGARHMSTLLLEAVKKVAEDKGSSEDVQIVKALIKKAKEGDTKAIDIVFDRIEGKAPQSIDITTDGDKLPSSSDLDVESLATRMAEELKKQKT